MAAASSTLPIVVSQEVLDTAAEDGVTAYLPAVLEMTNRVFPNGLREVVVEYDPEIANDRHISLAVKAPDLDVPQALEKQHEWIDGLFACCPAPLVCTFRLALSIA